MDKTVPRTKVTPNQKQFAPVGVKHIIKDSITLAVGRLLASLVMLKLMQTRAKRLNIIGAMPLNDFNIIAPVTFEGGCKRVTVESCLV